MLPKVINLPTACLRTAVQLSPEQYWRRWISNTVQCHLVVRRPFIQNTLTFDWFDDNGEHLAYPPPRRGRTSSSSSRFRVEVGSPFQELSLHAWEYSLFGFISIPFPPVQPFRRETVGRTRAGPKASPARRASISGVATLLVVSGNRLISC